MLMQSIAHPLGISFDPFQAGEDADPYPLFRQMREDMPAYHSADHGFFAVTRYADVQRIARDWKEFSNSQGTDLDRTGDFFGPNFLDSDPPDHRRIRGFLQGRFSPKAIHERLAPAIREQVASLVEHAVEKNELDLGTELAWPLPFSVACSLLGFPASDRDFLWEASRRFVERDHGERLPPARSQRAAEELRDYVAGIVKDRRRRPGDDLVSLLVGADIEGRQLSERELVGNVFLLFGAGTETTGCLLTNTFVLLSTHAAQRHWLAAHPEAIPRAVEEILRFESPIQHLVRTTTVDTEIHGVDVPAGATVALLYGAANRDPRRWENPEELDLSREPLRHLAFGEGIHHCLGAPIARLEAAIVLEALLPHLADFHLTDAPSRLPSHLLRGYVTVPVAFS